MTIFTYTVSDQEAAGALMDYLRLSDSLLGKRFRAIERREKRARRKAQK